MDVKENVTTDVEVWEEMLSNISRISEDFVNDADAIEAFLVELYEKKICTENLDSERSKMEKMLQTVRSSPSLESPTITLEEYRKLLEACKRKEADVSHLLERIQKEL